MEHLRYMADQIPKKAKRWVLLLDKLTDDDRRNWKVEDSDAFHHLTMPFSAVIASIVRSAPVLAWITEEDAALKAKGLIKAMPPEAAEDALARYKNMRNRRRRLVAHRR